MRRVLLILLGLASGVMLVAMTAAFMWPSGAPGRTVDLGHVDAFVVGSVTTFTPLDREGQPLLGWSRSGYRGRVAGTPLRVHVVHFEDGGLVAFLGRSPHLGCRVDWEPDAEWNGLSELFRDPCSGSVWLKDGTRVFGPTPRDLDRVGVEVTEAGRVLLHTDDVAEGTRRVERRSPSDATPTPAATVPAPGY